MFLNTLLKTKGAGLHFKARGKVTRTSNVRKKTAIHSLYTRLFYSIKTSLPNSLSFIFRPLNNYLEFHSVDFIFSNNVMVMLEDNEQINSYEDLMCGHHKV